MSISHGFKEVWTRSSGDLISGSKVAANPTEVNLDLTVLAGKLHHVDFRVYLNQLKSIFIVSSENVTMKTNSESSPQETIALKSASSQGMDLFWEAATGYFAVPFAGDLESLHFTNAGATDSTLQIRASVDQSILTIKEQTLPDGQDTVAYSEFLTAIGGIGTYTWSVQSGTLPTGLSLNTSTGEISGTPSSVATFNFTIRVTDAASTPVTHDRAYEVDIAA